MRHTIFQGQHSVLDNISFEMEGEFVFIIADRLGQVLLLKTLYADLPLRLGDIDVTAFNIRGIKPECSAASKKNANHLPGFSITS